MDTRQAITFRPGSDADLLEALAFITKSSRNEVLKQGLHALAKEHEPYVREAMDWLAKSKTEGGIP